MLGTMDHTRSPMPEAAPPAAIGRLLVPYVLFVVAAAGLHLAFQGNLATLAEGRLVGPDSYMRLVRVAELMDTGAWFDHTIERSNPPQGDVLHWTRPFDLLLIGLSLLLRPIVTASQSLYWAGALISPLLQIALCIVGAWAGAPLLRGHKLWLMPVLLAQWSILIYAVPGRADHHLLLLLMVMLALGLMLRVIAAPGAYRPALAAGLVHGLGLWASVELLPLLAINLAVLGLCWALAKAPARAGRAHQGTVFALGLVLVTGLATGLEHAPGQWLTPEYDRVSVVHLVVALLVLGAWGALRAAGRAVGAGAAKGLAVLALVGLGAGAALVALYPAFLAGPFVGVDPRVTTILVDQIAEMQPLWPTSVDAFARFLRYLGAAVLALPALAWLLVRRRGADDWAGWAYIAVLTLAALTLALAHLRFAGGFAIVASLPLAWLIGQGFEALRARVPGLLGVLPRAGVVLLVIFLPLLLEGASAIAFPKAARLKAVTAAACPVDAVASVLNGPEAPFAGRRLVFANSLGLGPPLLYRTRHGVVATPYHRNTEGIVAAHRILTATDTAAAGRLVAARGIELILICRGAGRALWPLERDGEATLHGHLQAEEVPAWLAPWPLPPAAAEFLQLYVVRSSD